MLTDVPPSLGAITGCGFSIAGAGGLGRISDAAFGLSTADVQDLFSFTRASNHHTRPPPRPSKKVDQLPTFDVMHMNVYLRAMMSGGTLPIAPEDMLDLVRFCARNPPSFSYKVQALSLRALTLELERKHEKVQDEPVALAQLRASLPHVSSSAVPHFTTTATHFQFIADTRMGSSEKDKFFSANVKLRNEGAYPLTIRVLQRETLLDGVERRDETDFQLLMDRATLKKGETSTILLSLIAKPTAIFNSVQEVVVLSVNELVKVVISFVVVNPSLPLFGTSVPCALAVPVKSPLGQYHVPVALEMLRQNFVCCGGLAMSGVLHVVDSAMFNTHTSNALRQASSVRSHLDELGAVDILSNTEVLRRATAQAAAAAKGVDGGGGSGVGNGGGSNGVGSSRADAASSPPVSLEALVATTVDTLWMPPSVVSAANDPETAFHLLLLWLAEYPEPVVDAALMGCEPMGYLTTMEPHAQGIIALVIDVCCAMIASQRGRDNASNSSGGRAAANRDHRAATAQGALSEAGGASTQTTHSGGNNVSTLTAVPSTGSISVRVLATTFAAVLMEQRWKRWRRENAAAGAAAAVAPTAAAALPSPSPARPSAEVTSRVSPSTSAASLIALQQHCVTFLVHVICTCIELYSSTKNREA